MLADIERRFIYFPDRALLGTPGDVGLAFDDVYFDTPDGVRLHGWFVHGDGAGTLLWCHGNGGNISYSVELLRGFVSELGVDVFIFDYRGYGLSEGVPDEQGLYADAEAALEAVRRHTNVTVGQVVVFGQSLGSAVAAELANRHRPRGVILESAFTSIRDMARRHYPMLPVGSVLRTRFDSLAKIKAITAPLLVLHGDRDDVVPLEMGQRLFRAAREPKTLRIFEGCSHDDVCAVAGPDYFAAIREFLSGLGHGMW